GVSTTTVGPGCSEPQIVTCAHAFLWDRGSMIDLGSLDDTFFSWAIDINDSGEIAGVSSTASTASHAVRWERGTIFDLGANGSQANAINNGHEIVGLIGTRAFVWRHGVTSPLPMAPGGELSVARAIHNRG